MEARLDQVTHTARSADHSVAATVTGRGTLVDLRISDGALDGAHPRLLGNSIVQAVHAARGVAHSAAVPEFAVLLGQEPAPPPAPPAGTTRRAQPAPVDEPYEESFDQVDFLSDEDSDERGGRR